MKLSSERLGATYAASAAALGFYLASLFALSPTAKALAAGWGTALPTLAGGIGLSLALLAASRIPKLRDEVAYELGYVFLFALALLLGLYRHLGAGDALSLSRQLSPVVIPILAFGALIPASPRRALIAYVGSAAMDPLALVLVDAHARGPTSPSAALAFMRRSSQRSRPTGFHASCTA